MRMAHTAPHDPAQHISAPFVRRQNAICDQEGCGPDVISDNTVRGILRAIWINTGFGRNILNQRTHQVDVIVIVLALQHGRQAFQAHPCVDGRARQANALLFRDLLILHEDEVPNLNEPVAILIW